MAAEFSANAVQVVPVGGSVIFTETPVPCVRGLVYHRDDTGLFRLANRFFRQNITQCWRRNTNYEVAFHANIAVPEGGTIPPEGISLALAVDGEIDPSSTMIFVPAAVEDFGNVGADIVVSVPAICSCSSVSVRNTSTVPINVQNANLIVDVV
jgi:hypothetical protein